jgi:hypothetical protein
MITSNELRACRVHCTETALLLISIRGLAEWASVFDAGARSVIAEDLRFTAGAFDPRPPQRVRRLARSGRDATGRELFRVL